MRSLVWILSLCVLLPATAQADKIERALKKLQKPVPLKLHKLKSLKLIVIDPGHGGENLGTRSIYGVLEKRVTLAVAKKLETLLKKYTNARIVLTRKSDRPLSLKQRIAQANTMKASVFLSLHFNADPKQKGQGIETYFLSLKASDKEALKLAQRENGVEQLLAPVLTPKNEVDSLIQQLNQNRAHTHSFHLAKSILAGLVKVTGWRNRGVKQAPFGVLKGATMPAVVVEMGFLSHPREAKLILDDKVQMRLAAGIVNGLLGFDKSLSR